MLRLLLSVMLFSQVSLAQDRQLIIRIPHQSETSILRIGRQLACLDGVHFSGYVSHASCILLKYDTAKVRNEEIITTAVHHLNSKLKFEVIRGMTAFEVIDGKLTGESRAFK